MYGISISINVLVGISIARRRSWTQPNGVITYIVHIHTIGFNGSKPKQ
jgi:hypothetical protein